MALMYVVKLSMALLQFGVFVPTIIGAASPYNNSNMNDVSTANLPNEEIMDTNYTALNPHEKLEEANRRFNKTLIPCIAYIGVLIIVGIIGNSLVFYVFCFRLKRSPQNFFILLLAVLDLLTCSIGLPAEITDVTLHFKFDSPSLCKIMRFVNAFTTMGSICTLIVIAVDRYRRVRKPLQPQITAHQARLSLIPILATSLFFSGPSVYVYGLRTIESGFPGVYGLDCTISDEAKQTIVPLMYNGVLFVCFLVLATSLIVMYALILRSLTEHAKMFRKMSTCTVSTVMETLSLNETVSTNEESGSSGAFTDFENSRKQSIPGQVPKTPANSAGEVLSVGDLNSKCNGSKNVLCQNDGCKSGSSCSQSTTLQEEDCADMSRYDFSQKEVTETSHMSSSASKESDVTDKDIVTPDIDKCTSNATETWAPTDCANELNSGENTSKKNGNEITDEKIIEDHQSGNENASPKRPNINQHVSFDVSCTAAAGTGLPDLKTWSHVRSSTSKRKLSETSLLRHLDNQSQKYVNQILKAQKSKEYQESSNNQMQKKQETETPKQRQFTRKTTIIAFVVTLVFIISFVPHLCLQVAHLIRKGFDEKLEGAPLALYNTFLRSYFINSVANPIIYGLMNEKFRTEVKLLATCSKKMRRNSRS